MNHPFGEDFNILISSRLPEREYFSAICKYVEFNQEDFAGYVVGINTLERKIFKLERDPGGLAHIYKNSIVIHDHIEWNKTSIYLTTNDSSGSCDIENGSIYHCYFGPAQEETHPLTDSETRELFASLSKKLQKIS